MTKIYTKKGDQGQTSLFGGRRVSKSIVRLEVIGCLDEANSLIGLVVAKLNSLNDIGEFEENITQLQEIQAELFQIGADIATPYSVSSTFQKRIARMNSEPVTRMEKQIDEMEKHLPPLKYFILPGGHEIASYAQLARAVVRRAERNTIRLSKGAKVNKEVLKYLNRLSDWLFVFARKINCGTDSEEIAWK